MIPSPNIDHPSEPSLRMIMIQNYHAIRRARNAGWSWARLGKLYGRTQPVMSRGWDSLQKAIEAGKVAIPNDQGSSASSPPAPPNPPPTAVEPVQRRPSIPPPVVNRPWPTQAEQDEEDKRRFDELRAQSRINPKQG